MPTPPLTPGCYVTIYTCSPPAGLQEEREAPGDGCYSQQVRLDSQQRQQIRPDVTSEQRVFLNHSKQNHTQL